MNALEKYATKKIRNKRHGAKTHFLMKLDQFVEILDDSSPHVAVSLFTAGHDLTSALNSSRIASRD